LFEAVDNPEPVRTRLAETTSRLQDSVRGARWVAPGNWHVTMKFLGSVYPRLRQWVGERAAEAARAAEPFETRITVMGAFPSPRRARVLWAGLEDSDGRLARLAGELDRLLEREFRVEQRPFSAHLTVARFREQVTLDEEMIGLEVASEPFRVDSLTLYRSHLQRPAARYEALQRIAFGG